MRSISRNRFEQELTMRRDSAPYMPAVARGWAKFHQQLSRIPTFVVLMISGALMNFMISFVSRISLCSLRCADLWIAVSSRSG